MSVRLALAVDVEHPNAAHQVDLAQEWVTRTGGALDLLYAEGTHATTRWISDPAALALVNTEIERMREVAAARLTELLQRVPEPHRGVARVLAGPTVEALIEASSESGYDALLVATHGRRGLTQFWLGSVAERLVRHATVPVMVLRLA
jgi:nucleotide-binding universal stress UspA family protein